MRYMHLKSGVQCRGLLALANGSVYSYCCLSASLSSSVSEPDGSGKH